MSDKYIIKNCPAIYGIDDGFLCSDREDDESEKYCYDRTDCLLKQIYEICKNNALIGGIDETAEKVVDLLDIQECE